MEKKIILRKVEVGEHDNEIKAEHYVVENLIPQIKVFAPLMDEDSRKVAWKRDMDIIECKFGTNLKNRWDLVEMIQEAYAEEISKFKTMERQEILRAFKNIEDYRKNANAVELLGNSNPDYNMKAAAQGAYEALKSTLGKYAKPVVVVYGLFGNETYVLK